MISDEISVFIVLFIVFFLLNFDNAKKAYISLDLIAERKTF